MTGDFDSRLRTAIQRAQAVRQSVTDQLQEQTEEARIAKINAAINEWNIRIQPAIRNVVRRANEIVRCADLVLTLKILVAHEIALWRRLPARDLPVIVLTAQYSETRSSGKFLQPPRLEFEITPDAKLLIRGRDYPSSIDRVLEVSAFTEKTAEDTIAEFVEAVLPKPNYGQIGN